MRTAILSTAIVLMMALPATAAGPSQTITIWGTGSFEATGVVLVGTGICFVGVTGTELDCGSDFTDRGTGSFDVSGWNSESGADVAREIKVEAQLNGLRPGPATGYVLIVCSDLGDDGFCAEIDSVAPDVFGSAHSDTDGKATLTMCVPVDTRGTADYDDLNVFIGNWVDPGTSGNPPGAGVSEGAYVVTMTPGTFTTGCP